MTMNKSVFALLLTAALLSTVSCDKTKQLFPKPPSQGGDDLAEDVQLPDNIFADDIFQEFTDPGSGVVSYYLKSDVLKKDNSQSVYYTGCEMSNDERFIIATTSTNEEKVRRKDDAAVKELLSGQETVQETHGVIIDLARRKVYTFPYSGGPYPYLDPETDVLYYAVRSADRTTATFYKRELKVNPTQVIRLADFPASIVPTGVNRPISRVLSHITLTSDKKKVFIDSWVADQFYWGMLDLYSGAWEEWGHSTTTHITHGLVNPKHDDEALCAIDVWNDRQGGSHPIEYDPDGTNPRMQFVKKGERHTIQPAEDNGATHEGWTADGDHVYWCSGGIHVRNIRNGEYYRVLTTNQSVEQATHCNPSRDLHYWTFDDCYPDFYRGCRWKVRFLNAENGKQVYIYNQMPAMTDVNHESAIHPDPHPHFVCNDKYIICTMYAPDPKAEGFVNVHLSVTPVDQLIRMTQ